MGIKDWFGGDKKKQAYRDKVKEAVSDGKLSSTDMQELNKLRTELDVTDAADDKTSLRRDLYNEAVDAARSKGQLTQTGLQDLQKIQKFLALRDDQVEKTKVEVNRLRMLTEIRKGNLPVVSPTNVSLRGVQLEAGETPHYSLAVLIMDQGRLNGAGRILLRYSGTELLARVMVEGQEQAEIEKIAHELAGIIRGAIGQ